MKNKEQFTAAITVPLILLIAAGFAAALGRNGPIVGGIPVVWISIAVAFLIQWVAFVFAWLFHSEKFFDITGTITYLSVMIVTLVLSATYDSRSILLAILVCIWTIRLGAFLFRRIHAAGSDSRFDSIKHSFFRFLNVWTLPAGFPASSTKIATLMLTSTRPPFFVYRRLLMPEKLLPETTPSTICWVSGRLSSGM